MTMPQLEVTSLEQLRAWLEEHHTTSNGVWLVTWKKHAGDKHIPWGDFVPELLCFGWIDSQARGLDADRTSRRITPRRKGSIWSAINKAHLERLEAKGRIRPAGRAVIEAAKADGSWTFLDDIEALIEPAGLGDQLEMVHDIRVISWSRGSCPRPVPSRRCRRPRGRAGCP